MSQVLRKRFVSLILSFLVIVVVSISSFSHSFMGLREAVTHYWEKQVVSDCWEKGGIYWISIGLHYHYTYLFICMFIHDITIMYLYSFAGLRGYAARRSSDNFQVNTLVEGNMSSEMKHNAQTTTCRAGAARASMPQALAIYHICMSFSMSLTSTHAFATAAFHHLLAFCVATCSTVFSFHDYSKPYYNI